MTSLRLLAAASATAVLLAGCGTATTPADPAAPASTAAPSTPPTPSEAPSTTTAPPTPSVDPDSDGLLASLVVRGGRCVEGECREEIVVTRGGAWTYVRAGDEPEHGQLEPSGLARLTDIARMSRLDEAPAFTGTCPTAYDGSEIVVSWVVGDERHRVSSCERVVPPSERLVMTLRTLLDEGRGDSR